MSGALFAGGLALGLLVGAIGMLIVNRGWHQLALKQNREWSEFCRAQNERWYRRALALIERDGGTK